MKYQIFPETSLERKIVASPIFQKAMHYGKERPGHPEAQIGSHVESVLTFIDRQDWQPYRENLRTVALLHDIGKPRTTYSERGYLTSEPHGVISARIARNYIDDEPLITIIKEHDRYFTYFRKFQDEGRINEQAFADEFAPLNLPLLIRFVYVDLCERNPTPADWFQGRCRELNLIQEQVTPRESNLRIPIDTKVYTLPQIRNLLAYHGNYSLLDGLVDPRFVGSFGAFRKYCEGSIRYFIDSVLDNAPPRESMDLLDRKWFARLEEFRDDLDFYKSDGFMHLLRGETQQTREILYGKLTIKVAKQLDALTRSDNARDYLCEQGSQVSVNVEGCMVPLNIIEE